MDAFTEAKNKDTGTWLKHEKDPIRVMLNLFAQSLSHMQLLGIPWIVAHPWAPCPWNFSGKNTRVSCHFFFQGIFPT